MEHYDLTNNSLMTKENVENDYGYLVLRFSKNDALAYFGKIYLSIFESSYEFLHDQLKPIDNKFNWRFYFMELYNEKVKAPLPIRQLVEFMNWYNDKQRRAAECGREQTAYLANKLITNSDMKFLCKRLDFENLAYAQKIGFVDAARCLDFCMGYNEDYWIQSSNNCFNPYPVQMFSEELELTLNKDGWVDLENRDNDPFTTMGEILDYQYNDFIDNRCDVRDCDGNDVGHTLSYEVDEWIFKDDKLWCGNCKEHYFDEFETDVGLREEMIEADRMKVYLDKCQKKKDIFQRSSYLLKKFDEEIVAKGSDYLEGMLNLEGAFYTETLTEAAVIIQRAWCKVRYDKKYKIARKYINQEIDELCDEIGLVLAD